MKRKAPRLAAISLSAAVSLLTAGCMGLPASTGSLQAEAPLTSANRTPDPAGPAFSNTPEGNTSSETMTDSQEIAIFAGKIKRAVASSDLSALAGLCGYPVYISSPEGEGKEIKTNKELLALDPGQLFTEKLKSGIAAVNESELEEFGAGVMMGRDGVIVFSRVEGALMITGIYP